MTNGMKWFALCAVAALLFIGLIAFCAANASGQNCGRGGVRQVIPASQSGIGDPLIVCENGRTITP